MPYITETGPDLETSTLGAFTDSPYAVDSRVCTYLRDRGLGGGLRRFASIPILTGLKPVSTNHQSPCSSKIGQSHNSSKESTLLSNLKFEGGCIYIHRHARTDTSITPCSCDPRKNASLTTGLFPHTPIVIRTVYSEDCVITARRSIDGVWWDLSIFPAMLINYKPPPASTPYECERSLKLLPSKFSNFDESISKLS